MITAEELADLLREGGLQLMKSRNLHSNLGKTPAYILADLINKLISRKLEAK